MALGASTTVVECGFGRTRKDINAQQRHLAECKENALTKVLLDRPLESDLKPVLELAREVWGQWFGIPRASSKGKRHNKKRRWDNTSGADVSKRQKIEAMASEAAFLRHRRDSIDKLMAEEPCKTVKPTPVELGEKASKEIAFQGEKRFAKMIEAYQQDILPKKLITSSVLQSFRRRKKRMTPNA